MQGKALARAHPCDEVIPLLLLDPLFQLGPNLLDPFLTEVLLASLPLLCPRGTQVFEICMQVVPRHVPIQANAILLLVLLGH